MADTPLPGLISHLLRELTSGETCAIHNHNRNRNHNHNHSCVSLVHLSGGGSRSGVARAGTRDDAALVVLQHDAPAGPARAGAAAALPDALRGPVRRQLAGARAVARAARRALQLGRAVAREGELRHARVHDRRGRTRYARVRCSLFTALNATRTPVGAQARCGCSRQSVRRSWSA